MKSFEELFFWRGGYSAWARERSQYSELLNVYIGLFSLHQEELRRSTMLEF